MTKEIEEFTDRMVRNEVFACVSSIVADLANGYGEIPRGLALADLAEEAAELSYSVEDYEEALHGEGWKLEPVDSDDLPAFVKIRLSAERNPGEFVVFKGSDEWAKDDEADGYMVTGFTREEAARCLRTPRNRALPVGSFRTLDRFRLARRRTHEARRTCRTSRKSHGLGTDDDRARDRARLRHSANRRRHAQARAGRGKAAFDPRCAAEARRRREVKEGEPGKPGLACRGDVNHKNSG